jgi:hypothetical protein
MIFTKMNIKNIIVYMIILFSHQDNNCYHQNSPLVLLELEITFKIPSHHIYMRYDKGYYLIYTHHKAMKSVTHVLLWMDGWIDGCIYICIDRNLSI